jgi:hypothetical protein
MCVPTGRHKILHPAQFEKVDGSREYVPGLSPADIKNTHVFWTNPKRHKLANQAIEEGLYSTWSIPSATSLPIKRLKRASIRLGC